LWILLESRDQGETEIRDQEGGAISDLLVPDRLLEIREQNMREQEGFS
jgi:hypothetical protein